MSGRRVLLVSDWMPSPGGAEQFVCAVRDGLRAAGDDVRLLTSTAGTAAEGTADYRAFGTTAAALQGPLQIANPFAFRAARRAAREFRPDAAMIVLFAYHLSPAVIWALAGTPVVLMIADYKIVCPLGSKLLPDGTICAVRAGAVCLRKGCLSLPHWLRDQPRYAAIGHAVRQARVVLACSRHMAAELEANGIPARPVAVPVFGPGPGYARTPAAHPQFVCCGRLSREKGGALLVRAFRRVSARVPGARLTFVGDGPLRADIERLAADLGLQDVVRVTGWLDAAGVDREISAAWALVAPSLWAEPFGLVVPEAILRGVPVVASRTGGFAESVADGRTGLLVPNGDEDGLADCIERIARRQAFPTHEPDAKLAADLADRHSVERHTRAIQAALDEARAVHRAAD
jgi:glycosyltransferase involved in cell wall biosynthesis